MDYHLGELPIGFTIRGSDEIKHALAAQADTYRVELFFDVTECDVFSTDTNKMTGLRRLADMLDLDPACCIAFGDGRNDIEMLQWAGWGVAMGNACQDLKDAADAVCGCSWEDGRKPGPQGPQGQSSQRRGRPELRTSQSTSHKM